MNVQTDPDQRPNQCNMIYHRAPPVSSTATVPAIAEALHLVHDIGNAEVQKAHLSKVPRRVEMGDGVRRHRLLVALVGLVLLGAACGGEELEGNDGDGAQGEAEATVGLVLPGPINDQGYNEGHFDGVARVEEELEVQVDLVENVADPQQQTDALKNLAGNHDLVIAAGGQFADLAKQVASDFLDVQFIVLDGVSEPSENLHFYVVDYSQHSFVVGRVASAMSEQGKVGYIGGLDIPPTVQGQVGFEAGVESTDESVESVSTSIGTFNDPAKAREAGSAQIDSGVDVIYTFVDAAYPGVYRAAEDAGKNTAVIVANRFSSVCEESSNIAGTTPVDFAQRLVTVVEDFLAGEFGEVTVYGLESGLVEVVLCDAFATDELSTIIDETTQGIINGDIEVPQPE